MKFNTHFTTPPHWILACILTLSLAFTFTSCSNGSSGGSDDDSGQVTNTTTSKAIYTVTFDANGGAGSIASVTEVGGAEIFLPANTFTKEGYIFAGWATSADGSVSYSDKAKITLTENITLYAKWGITAADAISAIKSFKSSEEHTVTIAGTITADNLTAITEAINNSRAKISLDLGGATGIDSIGDRAFKDCDYLISMNIPSSVTSIGEYAFSGCSNLTSVSIPNSVTFIGNSAFNCCTRLTSIIIPDSVTSIGNSVFSQCEGLTSVTILGRITSIGTSTFYYCESLSSVNIPNGVTTIGEEAFYYCTSLTSMTIPSSVISIGKGAFNYCTSLTSVNIPDNVTSIGNNAFRNCSGLTSVTIPKSVTSINLAAFFNCSNLKTVNYKGSKEDWEKIRINKDDNEPLLNATMVYNYTGE